jgi:hypothetical protein
MECDSQASFLARTFVSLCLGCEPKARVATPKVFLKSVNPIFFTIMYIKDITNYWDSHHLSKYGWYFDCLKSKIPFKEIFLHE